MKTVLFIEEKLHVRENFIRLLDHAAGYFKVLSADTVQKALDIIEAIEVDIVVSGRHVSARELVLLDQCLRQHKAIKLIVMAERRSRIAGMLKAFEYKIQFDVPVDLNLLIDTLLDEFEIQDGGHLRGIGIGSFLQMIELEAKTCIVKVFEGNRNGCLYCDGGELIEAEFEELTGKEAAFKILAMEEPLISIEYRPFEKPKTIPISLMSLLLESGRLNDENKTRKQEQRRYKRFGCEMPVEFSFGGWSHQGMLSNISLSGAFLETRESFEIGSEIEVSLYSKSLNRGCRIASAVVRKDTRGVGIEFTTLSINQMAILRTVINEVAGL